MTKRLILTRHAKSSWDDPLLDDHDRVLNARGREAATALGDWLRAQKITPDQIIASSAKRTLETARRLTFTPLIAAQNRLYHASSDQMFEALKSASGDVVLMVGHNPGIADFAARLVSIKPDHSRFGDYPTAATLVVDFEIEDWNDLRFGQGQVFKFAIPADF